MKQLDKETLQTLTKFRKIFEIFRMLNSDMTIGECIALVEIAKGMTDTGGGLTVTELSNECGFPLSSTSRYTIKLAGKVKPEDIDSALISNHRDPMDDRRKELRLTPRGKLVLDQIIHLIK